MNLVPMVIETSNKGERAYDLYSRLLEDRIIMIGSGIDDDVANSVVSQLLFLDAKDTDRPISMYINSPGGLISSGLAIYDTMQYIKSPVHTICIGAASSMGAVLLAAGAEGHRYALPNARIMIHQPLGGTSGQAKDIQIQAQEIGRVKDLLNGILAKHTGMPLSVIEANTDRDYYMSAEQAKSYGIIDRVIHKKG